MHLDELVDQLDEDFGVASSNENLVQWAVTEENRSLMHPAFLERKTGLMAVASGTIESVRTVVFVTDHIVGKLRESSPCLLFTHHNFDYYEDKRGLQPIRSDQIDDLLRYGHSVYVAHAPLDTHPVYGTSLALAMTTGVDPKERFYNYFGAPTALIGEVGCRCLFRACPEQPHATEGRYAEAPSNGSEDCRRCRRWRRS
jgi:putative NIF3 family GTP cyclohydrolase 1 type 2